MERWQQQQQVEDGGSKRTKFASTHSRRPKGGEGARGGGRRWGEGGTGGLAPRGETVETGHCLAVGPGTVFAQGTV